VRLQSYLGHPQGGAVAVTTALMLVVLVGFLGIAIDLGRFYVAKSEMFNAADACALAAAQELDGNPGAIIRAESAGIAAGTRNLANLQSTGVPVAASDISFSTSLSPNSSYKTKAGGATDDSRYAMCTLKFPAFPTTLTQILGFGPSVDVGAQAVATLYPGQTACAIPLGLCAQNSSPPTYGFIPGQWFDGKFDAGGGLTGSFNWIDYTTAAGGAAELAGLLAGSGTCTTSIGSPVGQTGVLGNAAAKAWNSRFGLYQPGVGNPQVNTAAPDYTGFTYTATSWLAQSGALGDFLNVQRPSHTPYQGNAATGLSLTGAYSSATPAEFASFGASTRRLSVAPIVDCSAWASSQTVPIISYACVLLLHPITSPGDVVSMEYVGAANDPLSPCATSGLGGGSFGPLVPVLVQ
jgi:hypothetical protein